jgi:hypothetical protein
MKKQQLIGLLAMLVIVGSAVRIFQTQTRHPVPLVDTMTAGLSTATAEETAKLLGKPGKIVVITAADCADCLASMKLRDAFAQTVKKMPNLNIIGTETVHIPNDDQASLPDDVYRRLLERYPEADAVVSLVGPPNIRSEPLPKHVTKFVVIQLSGDPRAAIRALGQHAVDWAIIPRATAPANHPKTPKTPREMFDFNYEVVTPATVAQLAD